MDNNLKSVIEKKIELTSKALNKNNIETYFAGKKEDVWAVVETLLKENDVIASGGSMSLEECSITRKLRTDSRFTYLDRTAVAPEEVPALYIKSFSSDVYLCSSNAVTENGELYNVDGNCNRIACIAFGPKSVIMVVGYNKIVKDLDSAIMRVKELSAPANCNRLSCPTPCSVTGQCISLKKDNPEMTDGCNCDSRVCCNYLVSGFQRHKGRIKVIFVGEELGY